MYFKVYHKRSKQLLTTFNEHSIVDFCLNNKETIKNYYFSTGGQKDLMEWEVFAVKYSDLFDKKATERDQKEFIQEEDYDDLDVKQKKSRLPFIVLLLSTLAASLIAFGLQKYYEIQKTEQAEVKRIAEMEKKAEMEKRLQEAPLEKRELTEADKKFTAKMPTQKELEEKWKNQSGKLLKSLDFETIKEHMDSILPEVEECFNQRVNAGDRSLKGTLNMQIRLSGDGVVRDVLLKDEKYIGSLFGDCLIKAIKSKPFKMFQSREQIFSYYWDL
jgi:hypothetical protein